MIDADKLAERFAKSSYEIASVQRLVIQPKSVLRDFKTVAYGFLFTVRGEANMHVNGTAYDLQPGTVLHAAPGMMMNSRVIGESELEYYRVFYRWDESGGKSDAEACNVHFMLEPGVNPRLLELLIMLQQNAQAQGGIGKLRLKELFLSIMYQVLVSCKHRERGSSPSQRVIDEAVAYIHGHYMNPLTLDELAELHAMSPKRFSYFFHKYTGFRPIDYVIHYRMERASELLKAGDYPISDIAVSVGYANPLYFSRVFKKKFGMSPTAYKDMATKQAASD
ncbi:helix-turn-helix transcriptional regulator [Brevibacillus agri]|uniref:AraC family transcriptional regulator n=1 Tax=Brevibacillus TaxID=55080 RepID=UPI00040E9533|nr:MULTISPECIES: AraC family transcriptional regulator [Brevibacillus]MBY0051615.1 helix-turn-helix transcriptional regulator [Brevibacillus agri]QHZ57818.1 helix-turn-helix transcriptional regulator [Brevibacillus sp. NSP2.1]